MKKRKYWRTKKNFRSLRTIKKTKKSAFPQSQIRSFVKAWFSSPIFMLCIFSKDTVFWCPKIYFFPRLKQDAYFTPVVDRHYSRCTLRWSILHEKAIWSKKHVILTHCFFLHYTQKQHMFTNTHFIQVVKNQRIVLFFVAGLFNSRRNSVTSPRLKKYIARGC